jgi:hypothetical protein
VVPSSGTLRGRIAQRPAINYASVGVGSPAHLEPAGNSPEEFAKVMHTDIGKWLRVTREAGIKPQ